MENECKGTVYTISKGDTLYSISRKYQVPLAWILRANPYMDVYNLQIGETICIPSAEEMRPPMRPEQPPAQRPPMRPEQSPEQRPPMQRPPVMRPQPPYRPVMVSYVVEDGESIGSLLQRFDITLAQLLENNTMEDLKLAEGTVLRMMEDARD